MYFGYYFFVCIFFFFKQKTVDDMRISDWSSYVCSSDRVTGDASDEYDGSGGIEECGCGFDGPLEVFGQTAIAVAPCEGAFDDPSSGMDDEAGLIGEFADDFDRNGGGVPDAIAVVGAVAIGARAEGLPQVRLRAQATGAIAASPFGRMDQYETGAPSGLNHR